MSSWFLGYGFADVLNDFVIGAYPLDEADVALLERMGVERILNLAQDNEYDQGQRETVAEALVKAGIDEYRLELVDHGELPAERIELAVAEIVDWLDEGRRVYLHCRAGWQRSAAIAAGVVALRDGVGIEQALERVQTAKPSAEPLPRQREDLLRWWTERWD